MIHISEPQLGPEVERLVLEVLQSGRLAQGPMVEQFEQLCAEMAGTQHAVAVANGTVSLEAALEVLEVGPGDEVITSPLTFAATVNAALRAGATVRFADITDDFTMDPEALASVVGSRTSVLMPVHLFGLPADMNAIAALGKKHGLPIVEDAAQAHGASVEGRRVGSFGIGSFSFYATKNVAAGEGGVLTTSDGAIADSLRMLRNQGTRHKYEYQVVGRNLRLSELHAAVAIPQLQRLDKINTIRARNANDLTQLLQSVPGLVLPTVPLGRTHAWHQYTLLLPSSAERDRVVDAMKNRGVEVGVYYPRLVWDYPPYRDNGRVIRGDTPRAKSMAERCLSLPVHPGLRESDLNKIADGLLASMG